MTSPSYDEAALRETYEVGPLITLDRDPDAPATTPEPDGTRVDDATSV